MTTRLCFTKLDENSSSVLVVYDERVTLVNLPSVALVSYLLYNYFVQSLLLGIMALFRFFILLNLSSKGCRNICTV